MQHAVRHQELGTEHGLFVQGSVRSSQLESLSRGLKVNSFNSAARGLTTLLDPFALGAPSPLQEAAAQAKGAEFKTSITVPPAASPRADFEKETKNVEMVEKPSSFDTTPKRLPLRRAADGFGAQLRRSATDFRPRLSRPESFANGTMQTTQVTAAQRKPM